MLVQFRVLEGQIKQERQNHKSAVPYEDEEQEQKTWRPRCGGLLAAGGGCIVHTENISLIEPENRLHLVFGASEDQQG